MTQVGPERRDEAPCIWVQAGVLSYRPCDRHFDCDGCPLFHALKGGDVGAPEPSPHRTALDQEVNAHLARLIAGCTLHLDRAYSPGHWWVDSTHGPGVVLGLEGYVLRVLHPVDDIVTPGPGVWLRRLEPCGWLRRGHVSVPLRAPIAGEVTEVNGHYLEELKAWGAFDAGEDWLLRLVPHEDPEAAPGLFRGDEALSRHQANLQLVKRALREALEQPADGAVGVTLADGGEPNLDLDAVLGRARFDALVDALFHTHPS